nr:probable protein phosphatase 2C 60 isoform X1 [Tanacetum cinerariifolium]
MRGNQLVVANAGDSRCVISRKSEAYKLSRDHKPGHEVERDMILKAGGFIHTGRVNGSLNLTRAIGIHYYICLIIIPSGEIVSPETIFVESRVSSPETTFDFRQIDTGDTEFKQNKFLSAEKQIVTANPDVNTVNSPLH